MAKALEVIESHPTWQVIDPSKMQVYQRCGRKYFYNYVLGWSIKAPKNDLSFGTAWHFAVEHLLRKGYTPAVVNEAKFLFHESYRRDFHEVTDQIYEPKNPSQAFYALDLYADRFRRDLSDYEVLHTEVGGVVLIDEDSPMYFKMDAILRDNRTQKVFFIDHKTSKRKMYNWSSQWNLSTQMLTYLHALYCLYDPKEIQGGRVRGSFFYKSKDHEFDECDIEKTPDQMQSWLSDIQYYYAGLKFEMERLEECSTETPAMECFPRNGTACGDWGGCPYMEICDIWPNPLTKINTYIPDHLKIEFWNPRANPTIRERVDLTGDPEHGPEEAYSGGDSDENARPREEPVTIIPGSDRSLSNPMEAAAIPTRINFPGSRQYRAEGDEDPSGLVS
jgi:hypothetical protein